MLRVKKSGEIKMSKKNKILKVLVNGQYFDLDAVVNLMDEEIRATIHAQFCGEISEQEFVNKYVELHQQKFNEEFIIN
jgi:hypothetical protein